MPAEVVLMMDLAGVLMTSPFPAARRLAETMMQCVFERAGVHLVSKLKSQRSVPFLARQYGNFFFTAIEFTERVRGTKSAYERLELGEINRLEFIPEFTAEINFMLQALSKHNVEELEAMGITYPKRVEALRRRFPLLGDPVIQILIRELCDVEAFLCTMEKVSPRKNVLNLLHYLRVKSQQEIRLFAMGNTWETEGQYRRMLRASQSSVEDCMCAAFPDSCPVMYGGVYKSFFNVNGLFDGYVQSYVHHKRKPYPDIFLDAVAEVRNGRMPTGEALRYNIKPYIFYFDDVAAHCEVARSLPGNPFSEVYLVENGALDVYQDILAAIKSVGERDEFWAAVAAGVETDIGPLFKPPMDPEGNSISWVTEELNNYNNNLLFINPPAHDLCSPVNALEMERYQLDEEDQNAILFYCAQHLPHLFPLTIPSRFEKELDLRHQPGFATSAGPIVFEYVEGSRYFESYRITLRTGSYVLRIQPRGPNPFGSTDIRREYQTMEHLNEYAPEVRVPKMLLYCDSYSVCGRRFFLHRYRDGEVITSITQLIQPRIYRPYSLSRRSVNVELKPKLFYRAAICALAALHDSSLPPFMRQQEERYRKMRKRVHPLLNYIKRCMDQYNLYVETSRAINRVESLRSTAMENLAKQLLLCFDDTVLSQQMIPPPDHLVIVHGSFNMSAVIFSHRSLEGRAKYPPKLVGTVQFRFARLGDPLFDVATLALFNYIPAPEGIFGAHKQVRVLFPTATEIMDYYCSTRGYLRHLDRERRADIFSVYLAAFCLQRATITVAELAAVLRQHPDGLPYADSRNVAFADQMAQRGLELLMRRNKAKM